MNEKQKKRVYFGCLTQVSVICLFLAILLLSMGIYMYVNDEMASGFANSERYGVGRNRMQHIPYWFVIGLGIFFMLFPLADLVRHIKNRLEEKK